MPIWEMVQAISCAQELIGWLCLAPKQWPISGKGPLSSQVGWGRGAGWWNELSRRGGWGGGVLLFQNVPSLIGVSFSRGDNSLNTCKIKGLFFCFGGSRCVRQATQLVRNKSSQMQSFHECFNIQGDLNSEHQNNRNIRTINLYFSLFRCRVK